MWMMENPAEGLRVPDDLPHDFVLKVSKPYLGKWISKPSDWTPLRDRTSAFTGFNRADLDPKDPWQFKNFLVTSND
jgi:homospermidine synthase